MSQLGLPLYLGLLPFNVILYEETSDHKTLDHNKMMHGCICIHRRYNTHVFAQQLRYGSTSRCSSRTGRVSIKDLPTSWGLTCVCERGR